MLRWALTACCPHPSRLALVAGLLFFSTYTLLVLFWAEIYYQARSLPTGSLRPSFVVMNLGVYAIQVGPQPLPASQGRLHSKRSVEHRARTSLTLMAAGCGPPVPLLQIGLWVFSSVSFTEGQSPQEGKELSGCFLAFVSAAAAFAFLLYGGRLWVMLRRFPIESRGRRKKLREVGLVTTICATCFLFRCGEGGGGKTCDCHERAACVPGGTAPTPRCPKLDGFLCRCPPAPPPSRSIIVAWSAFDYEDADLDVMGHPMLNLIYYSGAEVIPSALVLHILRKLPPKRVAQPTDYQPLPSQ